MLDYIFALRKKKKLNQLSSNAAFPFFRTKHHAVWVIVAISLCLMGVGGMFFKLHRLEQKQKVTRVALRKLKYEILGAKSFEKVLMPSKLALIPYGEDSDLVVEVKNVDIRNVTAPYNPSLIRSSSGYDLFFRYDVISPNSYAPFYSRIGAVHLNDRFEQGDEEFQRIFVNSEYAEDPRALLIDNQLYLIYNVLDLDNLNCRSMCVASLDRNSFDMNYSTVLDMNLRMVEKNWSPFEYIGADQKTHFYIEYQISPHKLLELSNPQVNEIRNLTVPREASCIYLPWINKWGEVHGGTPPQKIDDEYLAFFHSSFTDDNGMVWYVMGAYTFEAQPPFSITGMSSYPILFRGIFETPADNTASVSKRVIFPSGFVIEKQRDRELIHVACGENDSGVKIVTLDKEKLIKSMNRIEKPNKKVGQR